MNENTYIAMADLVNLLQVENSRKKLEIEKKKINA